MEINEGDIVLLDSVLLPELDYPHRHMFEGGNLQSNIYPASQPLQISSGLGKTEKHIFTKLKRRHNIWIHPLLHHPY